MSINLKLSYFRYRCAVLPCENPNAEYSFTNDSFAEYVTLATNQNDLDSGTSCKIFQNDTYENLDCQTFLTLLKNPENNGLQYSECSHENLIFDHSVVEDSIVTEYGLTCDKKFIKNVIGTTYMVGLMIGSFGFGLLSDAIGRRKTLIIGLTLTSVSGVLGAFMPNAILFGIMRFLSGVGAKGLFMICFVLIGQDSH